MKSLPSAEQPGLLLKVQIFERTNGGFALEARAGKQVVIKNGFLEIVPLN